MKRKQLKQIIVGIATDKGSVQDENEDNFFCNGCINRSSAEKLSFGISIEKTEPFLAALFDGMGGLAKGGKASLIAAEQTYYNYRMGECSLEQLIRKINKEICRYSNLDKQKMGSTCVFLEKRETMFRSWNIGDSRAYLLSEGKLTQLSYDHTEKNSMKKLACSAGLEIDLSKMSNNKLSQHLGVDDEEFVLEPYVSEWVEPKIGEAFLLCSDGLTDVLKDVEIAKMLNKHATPQELCRELIDRALKAGSKDNITVILIKTK